MIARLDAQLLGELGLSGYRQDVEKIMLRTMYDLLEIRIGRRIAETFTREQVYEFNRIHAQKDDSVASAWLQRNAPDYPDVVEDEFVKLKAEVVRDADGLRRELDAILLATNGGTPA